MHFSCQLRYYELTLLLQLLQVLNYTLYAYKIWDNLHGQDNKERLLSLEKKKIWDKIYTLANVLES